MGMAPRTPSRATILALLLLTAGAAAGSLVTGPSGSAAVVRTRHHAHEALLALPDRGSTSSTAPTPTTTIAPSTSPGGPLPVSGDGIGTALFGEPESTVVTILNQTFGPPTATNLLGSPGDCQIGATVRWGEITTFYSHGSFAGYRALGAQASYPSGGGFYFGGVGHQALTPAGLRVGDTLARAQELYGSALTTSAAQGGSWSVQTPAGDVRGYLSGVVGHTSTPLLIESIGAGNVGCPADTP